MAVSTFELTVTDNGLPLLTEAMVGVGATTITRVEIGQGLYNPTEDQVALQSPYVPALSFAPPSHAGSQGSIVNIAFMDPAPIANYDINEIGLFSGNVLLGVASRTQADGGTLFSAVAGQRAVFAFSFTLSRGDPATINYQSTFALFPMTEGRHGTGRIASVTEILVDTIIDRLVNVQRFWQALRSYRANGAEALDRNNNDRAMTPRRTHEAIDDRAGADAWVTGDLKNTIRDTAPTGWEIADGGEISRTGGGADLFALIGTEYGNGDGLTTFNKPDLRGYTLMGAGLARNGVAAAIGSRGGADTHVLTIAEMPSHTHIQTVHSHSLGNHTHSVERSSSSPGTEVGMQLGNAVGADGVTNPAVGNTGGRTLINQDAGLDGEHNNMQPTFVVNIIIKL